MSTDEIVERVARAISAKAYAAMRAQGFSGGWDHDEFAEALARAAIVETLRAVREPTAEMIEASGPAFEEANAIIKTHVARGYKGLTFAPLPVAFTAMLDQLLSTLTPKDQPHDPR